MAAAATQIKDSWGGTACYHFTVTGLVSGKNTLNLVTLIGLQWPTTRTPQRCHIEPIYDASHTVASKLMYDPATLSNTVVDIFCDVTGSTSCELWIW